jgi:hypothetical protein
MLDGYRKEDPATIKKLPVQSDVPELLVTTAYNGMGTEMEKAAADLILIAFYYLLRVGEYTVKGSRNSTKQTVQFKYKDITFFCKNARGQLRCLPRDAPDHLIATADGATLKLDNQKNGWKGVCIFHEINGDNMHCPVRALGRRYLHLRHNGAMAKTFISAYFPTAGQRLDISNEDITRALKTAATILTTPRQRASRSIESIHILYGAEAQMHYPWLASPIHRSKKWVVGMGPHSRNISGRSWHLSPKGCQHK